MDDDLDDDDWEYGQDQWEPFYPDPHFHGTLTPIRRRGGPYANMPGSPWMASVDLTKAQTERILAMLSAPQSRPIVMEPFRVFHEPENP